MNNTVLKEVVVMDQKRRPSCAKLFEISLNLILAAKKIDAHDLTHHLMKMIPFWPQQMKDF